MVLLQVKWLIPHPIESAVIVPTQRLLWEEGVTTHGQIQAFFLSKRGLPKVASAIYPLQEGSVEKAA